MIQLPDGVFGTLLRGLFLVLLLCLIGNYALAFLHRPCLVDGWEVVKMSLAGLLGLLAVPESSRARGPGGWAAFAVHCGGVILYPLGGIVIVGLLATVALFVCLRRRA